jgi:hypothetical protein
MKKIFRQSLSALAVVGCIGLSSCDSLTHDDLSECPEGLVIDLVPQYQDQTEFKNEVNDVHLFIYDSKDQLVEKLIVKGSTLVANDYRVTVNVPEGKYRVVAWNGLSFTEDYVEQDGEVAVVTTLGSAMAGAKRADNGSRYEKTDELSSLWNANVTDITVEKLRQTEVEVPMVKDTNDFIISFCVTDGSALSADDYEMYITCENGVYNSDNTLSDSPTIYYNPYEYVSQEVEGSFNPELVSTDNMGNIHLLTAKISTLRLTTERTSYLHIVSAKTGKNLLTLNLNDYLLKAYRATHTSAAQDQEYFDSNHDYNMIFFFTPATNEVIVDNQPSYYYCLTIQVNDWILRTQPLVLGDAEDM